MSAHGPEVQQEVSLTTTPKVKEIAMKDFVSSMQRTDDLYARNYADLHQDASVELIEQFGNMFIAESTAPAPVAPIKPTEPVRPEVPTLGFGGMIGWTKHDEEVRAKQEAYAKEKAEYDKLKAEYDKQEPLYQQAKAKYDAEHAGYKTFKDGVSRTLGDHGREKLHLRPSEGEIKRDAGVPNEEKWHYEKVDAKDREDEKWRSEEGQASKFHAQERQAKNDFTRPIVNGFRVKTRTAADEHYVSERARLSKVVDHKPDPRQVAYDMRTALAKSAAVKLEEKKTKLKV